MSDNSESLKHLDDVTYDISKLEQELNEIENNEYLMYYLEKLKTNVDKLEKSL